MNTNATFLESGQTVKPATRDEPSSEASESSSDLSKPVLSPAETDSQAVEAIQELLAPAARSEEPSDGSPPDADPAPVEDEPSDNDSQVSIRDLASHLGTNAQRVYKDLQVPLGNGESLSLGELKDAHQVRETSRSEIAEREVSLQERESAVNAHQQELQAIMGEISPYLTQEAVSAIEAKHASTEARERQSLMEKVPEFKDATKFDAFRDELVEMMSDFGFQPHEVVIADHRLLMVGREMLRLRTTHRRWADAVEGGKLKGHKTTGKASGGKGSTAKGLKRQLADAAASNDTGTKVAAVSALIG